MIDTNEPSVPHPTLEEFESLADQILSPLFARLGYRRQETERDPQFVTMYYQAKERTLKVYYETRDDYMDIRYQGLEMDRPHNIMFVCKILGRPYDNYRSAGRDFRSRLETLARLVDEQLADVLTGRLEFQFTEADGHRVISHWQATAEAFVAGLQERVKTCEFQRSTKKHSRDWYRLIRPMDHGYDALDLNIGVRFFGLDVNSYVNIRHNAVEELFREIHVLATDGGPSWGPDTSTIHSDLYVLEGKKRLSLSIEQDVEFVPALDRFHADFVRIAPAFFEQGKTLEGAYQMLKSGIGTQWSFEQHDSGRVQRELCLACLLGRFGDAPPMIEGVRRHLSSEHLRPYGPANLAHFMRFVDCLRSKYPDLPTTIH